MKLDYDMNSVPNFVTLPTPEDYKKYYVEKYCKKALQTFDGIVIFQRDVHPAKAYEPISVMYSGISNFKLVHS